MQLELPDLRVELTADRGVFSAGGIDPGTAELLRAASPGGPASGPDPEADVLDLGCGYGPIAVALATRYPKSTVWAVDVNERAVALAAGNATRLGLANLHAASAATPPAAAPARPDVVPPAVPAEIRFAEIWSNPPIRIGKEALHSMLGQWLPRLEAGGRAWLVVHKHLGSDSLATWLVEQGFSVKRVSSKRGYRILRVSPGAGLPVSQERGS